MVLSVLVEATATLKAIDVHEGVLRLEECMMQLGYELSVGRGLFFSFCETALKADWLMLVNSLASAKGQGE